MTIIDRASCSSNVGDIQALHARISSFNLRNHGTILISSYRLSELRRINSQRSHIRRREPVDIGTPRCVRLLVSRLTLLPLQHASQFPLLADLRKTTRDKVTGTDDGRLAGTPCASASILLHVAVPVTVRAGVSRFARRGLARHARSVRSLFGFSRLGLLLFLPLWMTQAISLRANHVPAVSCLPGVGFCPST